MGSKKWKLTWFWNKSCPVAEVSKDYEHRGDATTYLRVFTKHTLYNLDIWSIARCLVIFLLIAQCLLWIGLNLALWKERRYTCLHFPIRAKRGARKAALGIRQYWGTRDMGNHPLCDSAPSHRWAGGNNDRGFKAVDGFTCTLEVISYFCVLERDTSRLRWSSLSAVEMFSLYWR